MLHRINLTSLTILLLIGFTSISYAGGKHKQSLIHPTPIPNPPSGTPLPLVPFSKILWDQKGRAYPQFASVGVEDPLKKCPLETFPEDLAGTVNQLTLKVRDSVAKIKANSGSHCTALANRLTATQAQLSGALTNQFLMSGGTAPATGVTPSAQDLINTQTQRASATNQLVLTVSDLVQKECISSIDDRIVIQRLIGQITTLGGLFWGSWPGIITAIGGQILGNLPIFTDEMDAVLKIFQKYDDHTERGTFLCLYREMSKTTCSLFSDPRDENIGGFDMTLNSGPARTTMDSLDDYKKKWPALFHDVTQLNTIHTQFELFLNLMEKDESLKSGSLDALQELRQACSQNTLETFENPASHPLPIQNALNALMAQCETLNRFRWTTPTASDFVANQADLFWSVLALSDYYEQLRKGDSDAAKIAMTLESSIYFKNLKNSFEDFRNPTSGNQTRMNYLRLTQKIGDTLAQKSLKTIMTANTPNLVKHRWFHKPMMPALPLRQRALRAMIDLCQTLDPTLACMQVGEATHSKLQKRWMKQCVGPRSRLCREVLGKSERGIPLKSVLLPDALYQNYFDSLCGVVSSNSF